MVPVYAVLVTDSRDLYRRWSILHRTNHQIRFDSGGWVLGGATHYALLALLGVPGIPDTLNGGSFSPVLVTQLT